MVMCNNTSQNGRLWENYMLHHIVYWSFFYSSMIFNNNIIDYITLRLTTSTNNKCNIYVSVIIHIHWLSSKIFRDLLRLVIYSVIHKRAFIPLRNLPTRIIEAVNHSSNSTIAFTRKITARCKIVCKCYFFFLSFFLFFWMFLFTCTWVWWGR